MQFKTHDDLSANAEGSVAIEFAFILPLLLFLFVGMIEATTALSYDRRVSKTGAAVADLVARATDVSGDMEDIRNAIAHQMTPFGDAAIEVQIGVVRIESEKPKIVWSWGNKKPTPWAKGSVPEGIVLSKNMLTNGQFYVVSTTSLEYSFILGSLMSNLSKLFTGQKDSFAAITLDDSFVLHPRKVSCVEYKNSCPS